MHDKRPTLARMKSHMQRYQVTIDGYVMKLEAHISERTMQPANRCFQTFRTLLSTSHRLVCGSVVEEIRGHVRGDSILVAGCDNAQMLAGAAFSVTCRVAAGCE